ncbi:MAG: hypothetical protein HQL74_15805 [Magnetococcales bacterium]|nr:hypothetical protein [Magnetococcales bacterium]
MRVSFQADSLRGFDMGSMLDLLTYFFAAGLSLLAVCLVHYWVVARFDQDSSKFSEDGQV